MLRVLSSCALVIVVMAGPAAMRSDVLPAAGFSLDGDAPICDESQLATCLGVARQALDDCESCRTTSGAPSALDTCQKGQCRPDFELQQGACHNLYCPGKSRR
jgi:hypothetical protein